VTVTLREGAPACTLVDIVGRETPPSVRGLTLQTRESETPSYLVTRGSLTSVAAGRSYHKSPELMARQVVDKLAPSVWRIAEEVDEEFRDYCPYKPLAQAQCSLSPGENGSLKLTLHSQPDVPDIVGRYVALEPKSGPIPVNGTPNTLGAWVKGNSNWGRLIFQVEDAKGNAYSSVSLGDWDVSDWRGRTRISFDGWKLITRGFPLSYASGHHGPDAHKWSRHDEIQYPVEVTRLYLILREKLVHVTDMVPAKSMSIELKDLTVGTDPTKLRRGQ